MKEKKPSCFSRSFYFSSNIIRARRSNVYKRQARDYVQPYYRFCCILFFTMFKTNIIFDNTCIVNIVYNNIVYTLRRRQHINIFSRSVNNNNSKTDGQNEYLYTDKHKCIHITYIIYVILYTKVYEIACSFIRVCV